MSYLFVLGIAGAALVALVSVLVPPELSQPARMPTNPNSTIRARNLFIVCVTFTKMPKRTRKKLRVSRISVALQRSAVHPPDHARVDHSFRAWSASRADPLPFGEAEGLAKVSRKLNQLQVRR